jgi:ankyrin repeat protein
MAAESESAEYQPAENIIAAADHGRLDLVTALLDSGVDANTVDEIGTSAPHNAARRGNWHIARLLLEKNASPRLPDGNCATSLRLAVREGHKQIVRLFLECDPPANDHVEMETHRLIRVAAARGHTEIVQLFLDCNIPTLVPDGEETTLHLAAAKGHYDICELLLSHDKALDRSLWARIIGPSLGVDAKDYAENTPFSWAAEKSHERTVEVFLREGQRRASGTLCSDYRTG